MRQINKKGNHLKEFYRYSYDNQRISDLLDRIESTDNQRKIERAYDFIHHACDNIDDCLQSGWYDLSDASWAYGTDYVIEELTDILNESVRQQKRKKRIHEAKKPRYWNSRFAAEVIDAYESGKLTLTNIDDWETDYNNGVKPNPSLGTKEILRYYISTGNDPRKNESVYKDRTRRLNENDEDVERFTRIIANQSDKDLITYLERIAVQNYVQGYGQSEGMLQIIREELLRRMS